MGAAIFDANTQKVNKQQNVNKPGLKWRNQRKSTFFASQLAH